MKRTGRKGVVRRVLAGFFALVLLVGAVALAVVAFPLVRYSDRTDGAGRLALLDATVSALLRPAQFDTSVTAQLAWSGSVKVWSRASGLVTALDLHAGVPVPCNVPIVELDGRPVVSYCGPRPLSSEVTPWTRGRDTDEFFGWLRELGFFAEVDDPSASQRRDAIEFWRAGVGLERRQSVDPAELVWLPAGQVVPDEIAVQVGQHVGAGELLFSTAEQLLDASVNLADVVLPPDGALVFALDRASPLPVGRDGHIAELAEMQQQLRAREPDDPTPLSVAASVRLAEPIEVVSLPASTLFSDSISACVAVTDGVTTTAVPVAVISSSAGTVLVDGPVAGLQVLVDPDRSLPCSTP